MIEGKTTSGFTYHIEDNAMNDMEIVDAITDIQSGKEMQIMSGTSTLINKLLGSQKKAFYDHYRSEDGRVPIEAVTNAVVEILASTQKGKN